MNNFKKFGLPIIYFALGILLTLIIIGDRNPKVDSHSATEHSSEWTCSMHPQIRQPNEGDCPICGMDLIPATQSDDSSSPNSFKMSEHAMALAGVQTTPIIRGRSEKKIHLKGVVLPNEERVNVQAAYYGGRIEELLIASEGEIVAENQVLARIYSPQLILAQQELLNSYSQREMNPTLFNSVRKKLSLLNVSDYQMESIIEAGEATEVFDITSGFSGFVTAVHISQGDYVKLSQPLYEITDLSQVWVEFDAYEPDLSFLRVNQKISFSIPSLPGKILKAKVTWIDPQVDPMRHTVIVRASVPNNNYVLKPNMLAEGTISGSIPGTKNSLIIPKSALLWTGDRSIVYVKSVVDGETEFIAREVTIGEALDNYYILKSGLTEGEEVVSSGTFSVDASAQLMNKQSMMNPKHKDDTNDLSDKLSATNRKIMEKLLDEYFLLTNNLVQANSVNAKKNAQSMLKQLKKLTQTGFYDDALKFWEEQSPKLTTLFTQISQSGDLEAQRKVFKPLSVQMIEMVKTFKINNKPVFAQYCPMADNDKGAMWLSDTKEILNPYFGDMMLRCGETKETIGE